MAGARKERVIEWLTSPESCFLLGAGCSVCAGKPLIGGLSSRVLSKVDGSVSEQFKKLKAAGGRQPTIEDLLNYLVRYQSILQTVQDATAHAHEPAWIEDSIRSIKQQIVAEIADKWVASPVHGRFLQRIGSVRSMAGRDVFTLNYDTVVEATLDSLRRPYMDGFRGTRSGWFDPTTFDETPTADPYFRVYKLHGSVNWTRDAEGHVRRTIVSSAADAADPVVVYPSEQKYLQTLFGVYETLMGRFRARLRRPSANNCLVTMGYSFNDDHINEALVDAMNSTGNNLTVIAFIGPDPNLVEQKSRLEAIANRCDQRFNAYVGKEFFLGGALDEGDASALLGEELWRFERLVDYVAGAAP